MADIKIQKKKTVLWPWIVGILAVIAIIWFVMSRMNKNSVDKNVENTTLADTTKNTAFPQFPGDNVNQTNENQANNPNKKKAVMPNDYNRWYKNLDKNHFPNSRQEVSLGLRLLSSSLDHIVNESNLASDDFRQARMQLEEGLAGMDADERSLDVNAKAFQAFTYMGKIIEIIAKKNPGIESESKSINQIVKGLSPKEPVIQQKEKVYNFFTEADNMLNKLTAE